MDGGWGGRELLQTGPSATGAEKHKTALKGHPPCRTPQKYGFHPAQPGLLFLEKDTGLCPRGT